MCQKVVKKLSKIVNKLSKSCQNLSKFVKKIVKSYQKVGCKMTQILKRVGEEGEEGDGDR
jgi:hypothetical protein